MSFSSVYRGFVRSVDDPKKLGRVKVHVPAVTGGNESAQTYLAWSPVLNSNVRVDVPPVGSVVAVMFENGNPRFPVVMGTILFAQDVPIAAKDNSSDGTETEKGTLTAPVTSNTLPTADKDVDYPNNSVWKTPNGIQIEVDDSASKPRLQIYHPSGSFIELYETGDTSQLAENDRYDFAKGKQIQYSVGDTDIESGGDLRIRTSTGVTSIAGLVALLSQMMVDPTTMAITISGFNINITALGSLLLNGRVVSPVGGPI